MTVCEINEKFYSMVRAPKDADGLVLSMARTDLGFTVLVSEDGNIAADRIAVFPRVELAMSFISGLLACSSYGFSYV